MPTSTRNARVALASSFLSELVFILPIWMLYGTEQLGMSVSLTVALFMSIWLGSALLEVPTGALADRYGRKRLYLVGVSLLAIYPLVYALEAPPLAIFALSLVAALGSALRTGTLVPLVHDAYRKEGRSDAEYHAFLSNDKMMNYIARTVASVSGGLLYGLNPHLPYYSMLIVYAAMFAVGLLAVDMAQRSSLSQFQQIGQAFKAMRGSRPVVTLIICYLAIQLVAESLWTSFQPFFRDDGLDPAAIGLIFSCIALLSAAGAYAVRHVMRGFGILRIQLIIASSVAAAAVLSYLPTTILHIIAVVPIAVAFGMAIVPITATVQKHVAPTLHSTALSVIGLMQFGVYGIASLCIGFVIDMLGVDSARSLLAAAALAVAGGLLAYYVLHRKDDELAGEGGYNATEPPETAGESV